MSSLSWVERDCGAAVKDFCKVETLRVRERRWCPAQGIRRVYLKATLTAAMLKACEPTEHTLFDRSKHEQKRIEWSTRD